MSTGEPRFHGRLPTSDVAASKPSTGDKNKVVAEQYVSQNLRRIISFSTPQRSGNLGFG